MWQQNQQLQLHRLCLEGVSGEGSECGNKISDYNFTAQTISRERCLEEDLNVANAKISRGQCLEEDLNVAKSLEGSVWRRV